MVEKRWVVAEPIPVNVKDALAEYPSVMRQLLFNRGIETADQAEIFLKASLDQLPDPFRMLGMDTATRRILNAVTNKEQIGIYGDYDVDGVTASVLMVQVLRRMGAEVEHYIPNRHTEGYGINIEALDKLKADGYSLVISVDCGIRSTDEAAHARKIDLDLIITDHHEPGDPIPDALAVICPKQPGDAYPYKDLAGVGIAYKLAQALIERNGMPGLDVKEWLDLVAVGTVADVAPLTGENRALVRSGLRMLYHRRRQGLRSLMGAAGIDPASAINTYHIGFMIGPRLNAAGRIETAEAAYNLLMTADMQEAGLLAQELDDRNKERQEITRKIQKQAEEMVTGDDELVFVASSEFQLGVVGLAASRLVETFYRPAVVGVIDAEKGSTRASCRSIPEFHISDALDEVADLMSHHGGHAMAAGFTVQNENLPKLEQELKRIARERLGGLDLLPTLRADMELPLSEVKPYILDLQTSVEPTGAGNPAVRFVCRNLKVPFSKKIGNDGSHLKMKVTDGRITYDAIAFRQSDWADHMPERIDILFTFEKNVYNGYETMQLNVQDLRATGISPQTDI